MTAKVDLFKGRPVKELAGILFSVMGEAVVPVLKRNVMNYAYEIRNQVINSIYDQTLDVPPLNAQYVRRKARLGYSTEILRASDEYVRSIVVIKTKTGAKIGVKNITHSANKLNGYRGGIPMWRIGGWLEYGTVNPKGGGMPPRPHWRPALQKLEQEHSRIKDDWTRQMQSVAKHAFEEALKSSSGKKIADEDANENYTSRDYFRNEAGKFPRLYRGLGVPEPESKAEFKKTNNVHDLKYSWYRDEISELEDTD